MLAQGLLVGVRVEQKEHARGVGGRFVGAADVPPPAVLLVAAMITPSVASRFLSSISGVLEKAEECVSVNNRQWDSGESKATHRWVQMAWITKKDVLSVFRIIYDAVLPHARTFCIERNIIKEKDFDAKWTFEAVT